MTITQRAEKHNLDPVAFRLALQEWIDAQEIFAWSYSKRHGDGLISSHLSGNEPNKQLIEYGNIFEVEPLIALPSLLEE